MLGQELLNSENMVVGAFPIAKLGILAIRQISKPIVRVIKRLARRNNFFKLYLVTPTAQLYNTIEVRSKLWMMNMGQPKHIPPLSNNMGIEMGSEILGELIVFTAGVSFILNEFFRQSRNDKRRHDKHKVQRALLRQRIAELSERVKDQDQELQRLKAQSIQSIEPKEEECY